MVAALVHLAVLLSGAAALAYQVAWIRQLANATSATITAQALVLAVFMAGLGLGSRLAGRVAGRVRRPLRAYALVEGLASLLALSSVFAIPNSAWLRPLVAAGLGSSAGLWVQLGVVCLLLLAITTLLGAGLPFVIEYAERQWFSADRARRGRLVGLLYGVNTLGAAAGCLVAGFVTIERWGLSRTIFTGAGLAAGAVALAGVVSLSAPVPTSGTSGADPSRDPAATTAADRRHWRTLWLAAALGGFVGLGAEVVWTRMLSLLALNTVFATTQVLAAVLVGVGLGGLLSAALSQRLSRSAAPEQATLRAVAQLLILAALIMGALPFALLEIARHTSMTHWLAAGTSIRGLLALGAMLVPPAALISAAFPLLVTSVRRRSSAEAFGTLYAANTIGSVLGSVLTAFVLLPAIGMRGATFVLEWAALVVAAMLLPRVAARKQERLLWAAIVVCALATVISDLPRDLYRLRIPTETRLLAFREGAGRDVFVTEDRQGRRRLWVNSSWVAGTGGGHRLLGHLPALLVAEPRRGLGIALGTGQTFAALLAHPTQQLDCVEIDAGVIELSTRYFRHANRSLFSDPRVRLHHDDGRAFLRATKDRFDVIVLEPLQAWTAGTSALYSQEFYVEAQRVLSPGGVLAQWIPMYGQGLSETKAMVATAASVFAGASLWLDEQDGILLLSHEPIEIDPPVLSERIRARGLEADLASNQARRTADLLALFLLDAEGIARWTAGASLLRDDHPVLEFRAAARLGTEAASNPLLRSVAAAATPVRAVAGAQHSQAESAAVWAEAEVIRELVLAISAGPPSSPRPLALRLEAALAEAPDSDLLRKHYVETVIRWASLAAHHAGLQAEAAIYERAWSLHPELGKLVFNLAMVYRQQGRRAEAELALREARRLGALPTRATQPLE